MFEKQLAERWIRRKNGFERTTFHDVSVVEGGASNNTWKVMLQNAPFDSIALRLEPEHGIFEPYSVNREATVLNALRQTNIPTPFVIGIEEDPDLLGAPFFVMEWVNAKHMGEVTSAEAGPLIFSNFVEMVVRIHKINWKLPGFSFMDVPNSIKASNLAELTLIAQRMELFPGAMEADGGLLPHALDVLNKYAPSEGTLAFCQGDINIHNYLVKDSQIAAVVDWEQARIGDPRSDVGQLIALSNLRGFPFADPNEMPFVGLYEDISGAAVQNMEYFRARWLFELGVIYYGWRHFNDSEPWFQWGLLKELLGLSLTSLDVDEIK
jgi:aminoglycoside phosphotransferase (APT) family kinase protein